MCFTFNPKNQADNPDTVDELFEKVRNGEVWKRQTELQAEAMIDLDDSEDREYEDIPEEGEWKTDEEDDEGHHDGSQVSTGTESELFHSGDEEMGSVCTTPELFSSPGHSKGLARARKGKRTGDCNIGKLVGTVFPTSTETVSRKNTLINM